MTRPVFPIFVGSGRSGTTLVQSMFSAHGELAITHESMFVPRLANRPYAVPGRFDSEAFLRDLKRVPDYLRLEIDERRLRQRLASVGDYADAVRAVFAEYAEARGKPRYGDKSPGYVLHMPLLADLFPEARFVHVVRDGRAVALSYVETNFGPADVPAGAQYWKRRVTAGRRHGATLGPARYAELRYEDLVSDPETELRRLCPFLDLDFDPAMLRYFEQGEKLRAETADPSAHRSLSLPPTKGLRDWRTQMSATDVAIFEILAGDTLRDFGYELSSESRGPAAWLGATRAWLGWQTQRGRAATRRLLRRRRRGRGPE